MNTPEDQDRREAERLERALSGKLHRAKPAPAKKWETKPLSAEDNNNADLKRAKSASDVTVQPERHPAAVPVHHEAPAHTSNETTPTAATSTTDTAHHPGLADAKEAKKQADEEEERIAKFLNRRGYGNLTKDN